MNTTDPHTSTTKATGVTVAVSRSLKPGAEERFAELAKAMDAAAAGHDGYLGSGYVRPATAGGDHTIVYRFDTPEHLEDWVTSPERARLLEEIEGLLAAPAHEERATGLEYWFEDAGCPAAPPPSRWKQGLVTWIGLFPTVYVLGLLLGDALDPVWTLPRIMITTAITVVIMTVAVMPALTRLLRGFLRPETRAERST
jgi:antibiotic biosynthesis monooxygenase (ABM) superfamily enzyme